VTCKRQVVGSNPTSGSYLTRAELDGVLFAWLRGRPLHFEQLNERLAIAAFNPGALGVPVVAPDQRSYEVSSPPACAPRAQPLGKSATKPEFGRERDSSGIGTPHNRLRRTARVGWRFTTGSTGLGRLGATAGRRPNVGMSMTSFSGFPRETRPRSASTSQPCRTPRKAGQPTSRAGSKQPGTTRLSWVGPLP
jgi:hypothetical protein